MIFDGTFKSLFQLLKGASISFFEWCIKHNFGLFMSTVVTGLVLNTWYCIHFGFGRYYFYSFIMGGGGMIILLILALMVYDQPIDILDGDDHVRAQHKKLDLCIVGSAFYGIVWLLVGWCGFVLAPQDPSIAVYTNTGVVRVVRAHEQLLLRSPNLFTREKVVWFGLEDSSWKYQGVSLGGHLGTLTIAAKKMPDMEAFHSLAVAQKGNKEFETELGAQADTIIRSVFAEPDPSLELLITRLTGITNGIVTLHNVTVTFECDHQVSSP